MREECEEIKKEIILLVGNLEYAERNIKESEEAIKKREDKLYTLRMRRSEKYGKLTKGMEEYYKRKIQEQKDWIGDHKIDISINREWVINTKNNIISKARDLKNCEMKKLE